MAQPEPREWPLHDVPRDLHKALHGIRNARFLGSQAYQEQQWRALREGAHPEIVEFERVFIKRMAKLGVPMFAHNMVRTLADQKAKYVQGFSKNDGRRPYPHRGFAVDIVHSIDAWNLSEPEWALVGHVGKEVAQLKGIKVTWGGDWKYYDPAHWELTEWKALYSGFPFAADLSNDLYEQIKGKPLPPLSGD